MMKKDASAIKISDIKQSDNMPDKMQKLDAMPELECMAVYLRPCSAILCLATHSKLGLSQFVAKLRARAPYFHKGSGPVTTVIDGGIISRPVLDYLPETISLSAPPARIIILMHQADPPRLGYAIADELHAILSGAECLFHLAEDQQER